MKEIYSDLADQETINDKRLREIVLSQIGFRQGGDYFALENIDDSKNSSVEIMGMDYFHLDNIIRVAIKITKEDMEKKIKNIPNLEKNYKKVIEEIRK